MNSNWNQLTKVELNVADYDNLVSQAQANEDEINRRALELYRKNGVCKIELNVSIRNRENPYRDGLYENYYYELSPYVKNAETDYCEPEPFCINKKMAERIKKVATDIADCAFYHHFGRNLKEINNILDYQRKTEAIRHRFIVVTITGWLLAVIIILISIFL